MDRITRYISLTIVALVIALCSMLYVGYGKRGPSVAMTNSRSDAPASFDARFHFGA